MGKKNKGSIPCDGCDRTFASIPHLQQHVRDKHRNPPPQAPPIQAKSPAEKPQVHTPNKPVPTPFNVCKESVTCEHCPAHFTSKKGLEQHKLALHSWKCGKCPALPPFKTGIAWQIHFDEVHAASARTGKSGDTKRKEVKTHSNEGKTDKQRLDVNHDDNTKTQKEAMQPESSSSSLPNVKGLHIGNPPLGGLTPRDSKNKIASPVSDDKAESQPIPRSAPNVQDQTTPSDERDPLSPKGATLGLLIEIDPEPRRGRDETTYEIASDVWSPTMTVSSIEADRSEEEDDMDMFPSRSLRPLNGSSPQKRQDIIVPPRVPKIGGRESRTLSGAIVAGNHLRDKPNVQRQQGLDGATPSLTNLEPFEGSRSESPTSTSFSSRDGGRDMEQGDPPHDPLPTRRSKPGPSEAHFECRICLLDPTPASNLAATHCGHLFCYECIATEVLRTSRCPVCKNVLALYCLFKLDVAS